MTGGTGSKLEISDGMLALLAHVVVLILGEFHAQFNRVAPGTRRERGSNTTVVAAGGDK